MISHFLSTHHIWNLYLCMYVYVPEMNVAHTHTHTVRDTERMNLTNINQCSYRYALIDIYWRLLPPGGRSHHYTHKHGELTADLLRLEASPVLFRLHAIPDSLGDVALRALFFQEFLVFFMAEDDSQWVFVLLQNKFGANHSPLSFTFWRWWIHICLYFSVLSKLSILTESFISLCLSASRNSLSCSVIIQRTTCLLLKPDI